MDIWQLASSGLTNIAAQNTTAMIAVISIFLIILGLKVMMSVVNVGSSFEKDEKEISEWRKRRSLARDWEQAKSEGRLRKSKDWEWEG